MSRNVVTVGKVSAESSSSRDFAALSLPAAHHLLNLSFVVSRNVVTVGKVSAESSSSRDFAALSLLAAHHADSSDSLDSDELGRFISVLRAADIHWNAELSPVLVRLEGEMSTKEEDNNSPHIVVRMREG